jgi:hypothetical protein
LEQGEVVLVFLGPADEDPAVAVEPGVGCFDDPASCAPSGDVELVGDLFAAGTDVRRELVVGGEVVALAVVIGLVQAEALWRLGGRLGSLDRDRVERRLQELVVVAVGTVVCQPDRDPAALAENRTFRPFFALSVGFGPVLGPPSGALVIAPSAASHAQSIPTTWSYSNNPCLQISANTPACSHSWNRRCAELDEQIPVAFNAFHCIPVRSTSRIASIASRSGTRERCVPNG